MTITAHWVRGNETSRAPNRWIWLDTEAVEQDTDGTRVQSWRLAVTGADWLNEKSRRWQTEPLRRHEAPEGLWDYVESFTRKATRTIVAAHNMGYDIRIAQAIPMLQARDWELIRWQVSDQGCVLRWRKNDAALWLIDSHSWLTKSLGEIGSLLDIPKEELPGWDAPTDEWWRRCETDVVILRNAMLPMVKWVREGDLGNWQPTAGSMAWANWRHKHYTNPVLVHDDDDARIAERSAGYTGRCEAWKHGRLPYEEWSEWDLPLAYPRVCLDTPMPCILRGKIIAPTVGLVCQRNDRNRYLVYAEITQTVPVLPTRLDHKILWPVGTFSGWYWDRELVLALEHGARIRPLTAYRYSAQYALKDWAEWIIDTVENPDAPYTGVQRLAAKGWARALIGRFGTRYWAWEDWGDDEVPGVRMDWLINGDTLEVGRLLHVAGKMFGATEMADGANSVPAIMSAVMSECRIRLWEIIQQAGAENVAYVDTDSAIVNTQGRQNLCWEVGAVECYGLRQKSSWKHLQVIAPRQLILDDYHRVSGVSRNAQRVGINEWVGERWEGLTAATEAGHSDHVIIRPTKWELSGVDNRRQHLDDGSTAPFTVTAS